MKKLFLFFILLLSFKSYSQVVDSSKYKNILYYEADIITDELIQNYQEGRDKEMYVHDRTLGVNVYLNIDTIFKKYTVSFTDQDGNEVAFVLKYIRDYFLGEKSGNPAWNKIYLMESQGSKFVVTDYLDVFPFHDLEIRTLEKLPNNCTLLYRVKKNVKKFL